ncbi:MAG: hemerythrin domain-containing protein [Bacteroidetes bacterium]|nr:hemerythrin domain-containing protein [Bacteroidota bacterium]
MKRHDALIPLSRDHHQALILSRLLRNDAPVYKGLPQDAEGKMKYAKDYFLQSLSDHFDQEELVFEKVKNIHKDIDQLITEIVQEHTLLREKFTSLTLNENITEQLNQLGRLLETHIRKEERNLFPLIEQHAASKIERK